MHSHQPSLSSVAASIKSSSTTYSLEEDNDNIDTNNPNFSYGRSVSFYQSNTFYPSLPLLTGLPSNDSHESLEKLPLQPADSFVYPVRMSAILRSPHESSDPGRESVISLETNWRRRQTIKRGVTRRVKLIKGNFIVEYPVPTAVRNAIESKYTSMQSTEFSHMRYTAATCDPDDFTEANGLVITNKVLQPRNGAAHCRHLVY